MMYRLVTSCGQPSHGCCCSSHISNAMPLSCIITNVPSAGDGIRMIEQVSHNPHIGRHSPQQGNYVNNRRSPDYEHPQLVRNVNREEARNDHPRRNDTRRRNTDSRRRSQSERQERRRRNGRENSQVDSRRQGDRGGRHSPPRASERHRERENDNGRRSGSRVQRNRFENIDIRSNATKLRLLKEMFDSNGRIASAIFRIISQENE